MTEICLGCGAEVFDATKHAKACKPAKKRAGKIKADAMTPAQKAQAERERQGRNLMKRVARADAKRAQTSR